MNHKRLVFLIRWNRHIPAKYFRFCGSVLTPCFLYCRVNIHRRHISAIAFQAIVYISIKSFISFFLLQIQIFTCLSIMLQIQIIPMIANLYRSVEYLPRFPLQCPYVFLHTVEIAASFKVLQFVLHDLGNSSFTHAMPFFLYQNMAGRIILLPYQCIIACNQSPFPFRRRRGKRSRTGYRSPAECPFPACRGNRPSGWPA